MVDFKKELKDLEENPIISFLVAEDKYNETNISILKILINEFKMPGVYITVNKPYKSVAGTLKNNGIDTSKIFFIDTVTKLAKGEEPRTENCLFMESPESLTDLSIALGEAVNSIPGDKFIFLDTLSTLLIYNEAGTVTKFAHFLTSRMRAWSVKGIIISLIKETKPELQAELAQFCDKIVDVGGKNA